MWGEGAGALGQWLDAFSEEVEGDRDDAAVLSWTEGPISIAYALEDLTGRGTIQSVTVSAFASRLSSCEPPPLSYPPSPYLTGDGYLSPKKVVDDGFYAPASHTWTTNPATGLPWTAVGVNALQAGITKSGGTRVDVTLEDMAVAPDRTTYACANGPSRMNTLTSFAQGGVTTSFTYDANGNMLSKFGATKTCYEWNAENLLTRVKSVSSACTDVGTQMQAYQYDGTGRRVKVDGTSSSTWTVSIVSGMDVIYEKDQAGGVTKYVYANGMRIAKITPSGAVQYFLGDHLGSTRQVWDSSRGLVFSAEYEPFGKPYSVSGTEAYKFTMEKHDDPTGLVYLRARQYDPEIGRFVSADPVLGSLSRPQTQNRYAYVINNPLRFTDPTGEVINLIAAGIGAAIGAAVGYGACVYFTGGWTSSDCLIAAGAGAAVGGLAGLTFGASLALAGTAGLGTATATGGFTFAGASGLAAFTFAGAVSGAVAGGAEYLLSGGIARAQGQDWQFSSQEFVQSVGWGAIAGAASGAATYGLGKLLPRLSKSWHPYEESHSQGPRQWKPNGIWDQIDNSGNLRYRSIYDRFGNKVIGIHMEPGHGFASHVHGWTRYTDPSGVVRYGLEEIRALRWTDMIRYVG